MDIKTRLYRFPWISEEVQELQGQLDGLREQRYNAKVTAVITGMPGGGQVGDPVYQSVEKIVCDYDEKMATIHDRIHDLTEEHMQMSEALWTLDQQQRRVIELRCFERRRWNDVGQELHFSRAQCRRFYEKGVESLEGYFEKHKILCKKTANLKDDTK